MFKCRSLDACMVSPGKPTPFPMISMKPDLEHGISYGLANNAWGKASTALSSSVAGCMP